ncbi:MAG: TolC family protein [Myxococcota bacterium]
MHRSTIGLLLSLLTLAGVGTRASADELRVTLDEALAEARRANAVLPVARLDAEGAEAAVGEAQGRRLPSLAFDGDVHTGAPQKYASSDARAQLVASMPLFDGGRLRAGVTSSLAAAAAARARSHQAERDVDLQVRARFAEFLAAEREIAFRSAGLERLRTYLSIIDARRASGQGIASDRSKTLVRLGEGEADIADAQRRLDDAKLQLNDLMGRPPDAPLELEPPPPPTAPPSVTPDEPWLSAPEVTQADASAQAASAAVTIVRADRWPTVSVLANGGAQPVIGNSREALLNNGEGWGGEFLLQFNLPLWDAGVYSSRLAQANLEEKAARQQVTATQRAARLEWQLAAARLRNLEREVAARTLAIDTARDSYLQAESLYRGGVGTALDVLEAYDAWTNANRAHADAELRYRVSEAELIRWGSP